MKSRFTPGPWRYVSDREMIVSGHGEWCDSTICKVATGEPGHDEGNAQLIASAPDLVDACDPQFLEDVAEKLTRYLGGTSVQGLIMVLREKARRERAALIKAGVEVESK